MLLDDVWPLFEAELFPRAAPARQFNPYRDRNADLDRPGAPAVRRQNLRNYLAAYPERPPLLLLAEAPGPWGCRFSGVPLVSEAKLVDADFPIDGQPTSREDVPHKEYSATIFWRVMQPFFPHFFVWNSVPFHPHQAGEPLSIRNPTRREGAAWEGFLKKLLAALAPRHGGADFAEGAGLSVVAVGRKAERALEAVGQPCTYVRHPSQGGARKFEAGMRAVTGELGLAPSGA